MKLRDRQRKQEKFLLRSAALKTACSDLFVVDVIVYIEQSSLLHPFIIMSGLNAIYIVTIQPWSSTKIW